MSIKRQTILLFVSLVSLSIANGAHASPGSTKNFILFIPEALPSMAVDPPNAPTLAKLRYEGVSFLNSHSGFPNLAAEDPFAPVSHLSPETLVAAATGKYATAFLSDTRSADIEQLEGLQQLTTAVLPQFKEENRPFFLVYRLGEPTEPPPPSNVRPAYKPDARAADKALDSIESTLKTLGLRENTNIIVAAEHGFSRVLKVSHTSRSRTLLPREDTLGTLPPGFLAIDIIAALQAEDPAFELYDPDHGTSYVDWPSGGHPKRGNAVIAADFDPSVPYVAIEAHGAYSTIQLADFLSKQHRKFLAQVIVDTVLEQDYLGAVFVNQNRVGAIGGALPITHIAPAGTGTRQPDLVVAFASIDDGCPQPILCTSLIADTPLPEGEGIPNSFHRAGTWTFMAARGPSFQSRTVNRSPASNADMARMIAELLELDVDLATRPKGRVLTESLAGEKYRRGPQARKQVAASTPSVEGMVTKVRLQTLGSALYFDGASSAFQERIARATEPPWKWRWPKFKRFTISLSDDDE